MTEEEFNQLSDFEKRIIRVLRNHPEEWLSVDTIAEESLVPIDAVVSACLWMASKGYIKANRPINPSDVGLQLAAGAA